MRLSTVCPAPAGAVQLRDVRAWHGGTPNLSEDIRAIPNVEFYAPWFREPISPGITYADHQRLSARARHLTRFHVVDSSAELRTGHTLSTTPPPDGDRQTLIEPRPGRQPGPTERAGRPAGQNDETGRRSDRFRMGIFRTDRRGNSPFRIAMQFGGGTRLIDWFLPYSSPRHLSTRWPR